MERNARNLNTDLANWKRKAEKSANNLQSLQQKAYYIIKNLSTEEQLWFRERDLEMKQHFNRGPVKVSYMRPSYFKRFFSNGCNVHTVQW